MKVPSNFECGTCELQKVRITHLFGSLGCSSNSVDTVHMLDIVQMPRMINAVKVSLRYFILDSVDAVDPVNTICRMSLVSTRANGALWVIGFSSISDSCCFALLLHSLSMHRLSMAMENSRRRMKANCSLNASWGVMGLGIEPLLFNALSMCD